MNTITIFTKPSPKAQAIEQSLRKQLKQAGVSPKRDIIITIGGDGTTLMAIKEHIHANAAFVGISAGHLGFLQTLEEKDIPKLINALKTNSFSTIKAPLIAAAYGDKKKEVIGYGFNDIIVERFGPRAVRFDLHIDDASGTFIGDGVIFSTPLGSTAYSLAAGGPIIDSRAQDVLIVTPSNPHISALYSSLQRPHVLQKGRVIHLHATKADLAERPIQLSIDGHSAVQTLGAPIEIFLSDKTVSLLEITANDFHNRIDAKRLGKY